MAVHRFRVCRALDTNFIYFAPNLKFSDLDLTGNRLPTQLQQRIDGFYLTPALSLAETRDAFAAGVLVVCAIDALAWFRGGGVGSTARIEAFCRKIPDLDVNDNVEVFCRDFRQGLVHQGLVKNGGEFSFDLERIAKRDHERLIVNPECLALQMRQMLKDYIDELYRDPGATKRLLSTVTRTFKVALTG
jgi:hypothetical protein